MGFERDDEDSHFGSGPSPKLSVVGRLDVEIDGRPSRLIAENCELVVVANQLTTLLTLRRTLKVNQFSLQRAFERVGLRVLVRSRWFGTMEVLPRPHCLIRALLPRG